MKKSIILMMSVIFALCMVSCVPNEGKVIKKDFTHFLKVNSFDGVLTNFAYAEITDREISTSERTGLPLPEGFLDKEVGKKYIIRLDYYFDDEYGIDADFMYLVHIEHAEYGTVIDELDVVYHWMADRVEWKQIELDK